MYRYKHNPLARPSRISWSNSELKNWNSKRDVFDTRRNHPDRGIFVTIILVFLCCISCACVYVLKCARVCMCVPHICILYIYIRIYIYICIVSFIHLSILFFVSLILSLFSSYLCFIHLLSSFMIYEYIYSWTVVGNGWTESLSMKIFFFYLFFSSRFEPFFLRGIVPLLSFIFPIFLFFFFYSFSRYLFLSRDVRRTTK